MKRLLGLLLWAALLVAAQPLPAAAPIFEQVNEIIQELSRITGLSPLRRVTPALMDKNELRVYLEQRIREEVKPEQLRIEELVLKKFGLVPADFDLKSSTIDLFSEQAAAFYDYRRKKLYVLTPADPEVQHAALVHELAHALADQHFNLDKFIRRKSLSDDAALARLAVMEGQASWLMAEYSARRIGQSLLTSQFLADYAGRLLADGPGQMPVFAGAPLFVRESLLFPYVSGLRFQHALVTKLGQQGFKEAFQRPPSESQQVLHPELYFQPTGGRTPPTPRLADERSYKVLAEGTVGEFDHAVLLKQYVSEEAVRDLAPRWRGGGYRILEHRRNQRTVLAYASLWDSEESAASYFQHYQRVLAGKWKRLAPGAQDAERFAGEGDDGYFRVRLQGRTVSSLEGMPQPDDAR